MCDPGTMLTIATVGSTIAKGVSTFQETEAENKALEYNASVAEANAQTLEEQKQNTQFIGGIQRGRIFSRARRLAGSQQAQLAASGVRVDTGSAVDILTGTEETAEADALTLNYNLGQQIRGLETQRQEQVTRAGFLRGRKRDPLQQAGLSLLTEAPRLTQRFGGGSNA